MTRKELKMAVAIQEKAIRGMNMEKEQIQAEVLEKENKCLQQTEEDDDCDLTLLQASKSEQITRNSVDAGTISIVNAKQGKRIGISKAALEYLKDPTEVQVSFTNKAIVIGNNIPGNTISYNVKKSGGRGTVYSAALVQEITELFNLDFENRTSINFGKSINKMLDDYPVVVVKVK